MIVLLYFSYISNELKLLSRIRSEFSSSKSKTTDNCESLHSKLHNMSYEAYPNVEALKYVQKYACIKLESASKTRIIILNKRNYTVIQSFRVCTFFVAYI